MSDSCFIFTLNKLIEQIYLQMIIDPLLFMSYLHINVSADSAVFVYK